MNNIPLWLVGSVVVVVVIVIVILVTRRKAQRSTYCVVLENSDGGLYQPITIRADSIDFETGKIQRNGKDVGELRKDVAAWWIKLPPKEKAE